MSNYIVFGKSNWAKLQASKQEKQKNNRSAGEGDIFVNQSNGKIFFIKQLNKETFSINGIEYSKKLPTITITKKIKK